MKIAWAVLFTSGLMHCNILFGALVEDNACPFPGQHSDLVAEISTELAKYNEKCKGLAKTEGDATTVLAQMQDEIKAQLNTGSDSYGRGLLDVRPDCFNFRKVFLQELRVMQSWEGAQYPTADYAECSTATDRPGCLERIYRGKVLTHVETCRGEKFAAQLKSKQDLANLAIGTASNVVSQLLDLSEKCGGKDPDLKQSLLLSAISAASIVARYEPVSAATNMGIIAGTSLITAIINKAGKESAYEKTAEHETLFSKLGCLAVKASKQFMNCNARLKKPLDPTVAKKDNGVKNYVEGKPAKDPKPNLLTLSALLKDLDNEGATHEKTIKDQNQIILFFESPVEAMPGVQVNWEKHLTDVATSILDMTSKKPTLTANKAFVAELDSGGVRTTSFKTFRDSGRRLKKLMDDFSKWRELSENEGGVSANRAWAEFIREASTEVSLRYPDKREKSPFNLLDTVENYWRLKEGPQNRVTTYLKSSALEESSKAESNSNAATSQSMHSLSVAYGNMLDKFQPFFEGRLKELGQATNAIPEDYKPGDFLHFLASRHAERRTNREKHDGVEKTRDVAEVTATESAYIALAEMCLYLAYPMTSDADSFTNGRARETKKDNKTFREACRPLKCRYAFVPGEKEAFSANELFSHQICTAMLNFPATLKQIHDRVARGLKPCDSK
jgi:hypothetical protein